jgi:serine/threonine-protein kinase
MSEAKLEMLGRYKILDVIGRGAMGIVYKAVDPAIDRVVAIKTIDLSLNSEELEEFEARFQQEVKAAGRFSHPNVVTIYDVGRTEQVSYMAMEYLNGRELKDFLVAGQRPSVEVAVELIMQVADGLAYAHEHGIVHRDIKPSNIMVLNMPSGVLAKITDFGIARMPGSAVKTLTGTVLGSPRYMSPEQVIGKEIDARSDIFSLGVVLYETLTGVSPFDGDNPHAIMYSTCNTVPPPPSTIAQTIPKMLDLILDKALAKNVADRYQKMSELASDLREVNQQLLGATGKRPILLMPTIQASETPAQAAASTGSTSFPHVPTTDRDAVTLKISTSFDSLSATMKLAALGQQTDDFQDYLSQTQKLRAQRAKEAAAAGSAAAGTATKPLPAFVAIPRTGDATNRLLPPDPRDTVPLIPAMVLGSLALTAIGLAIALVVR